MSVVKEGGNKPVYTDFFIKIFFIRIPRRKNAEDYNFELFPSNVILAKIELLLPIPILLLP